MASILKRKNTVSCGYDQNGRQIRRTMTYKPEPNMTEKQVQKEVQRQAVLFEEQVRNNQVSSDGRLKLADFVPMYLETAKQKLSPYVYERYTRILDIGIIPALGHLKLKDIRPLHIQRFIDELSRRETRLGHTQLKTTNRYVHAVDQAERQAANTLELILGGNRKTG